MGVEVVAESPDAFLSDHTIAMRKALTYCQDLLASAYPLVPTTNQGQATLNDACQAARSLQRCREKAVCECYNERAVPVVDKMVSPMEFRRCYLYSNRPCKITDRAWAQTHFLHANSIWRTASTTTKAAEQQEQQEQKHSVNRTWFVQHFGKDTVVPVRYQPAATETAVDPDGRAMECETKNMTMLQWLETLDNEDHSFYLKDWHLQAWLKENSPSEEQLYSVPYHFEKDLLNNLLRRFTKGDYCFTYWGPDGSRTGLHSDVMNSFSWSFNVIGTKEWTFYIPHRPDDNDDSVDNCARTVVVKQYAGECMVVPAGWKHTVVNIGETLSINHNWITTANLDLTWQVIDSEIQAVDAELRSWGSQISADWDSKESMLLGCIGLNVTAFAFMVLVGILELLQCETDDSWERYFDVVRLGDILCEVHRQEKVKTSERFCVSLADDSLGAMAGLVVKGTLKLLDHFYQTNTHDGAFR